MFTNQVLNHPEGIEASIICDKCKETVFKWFGTGFYQFLYDFKNESFHDCSEVPVVEPDFVVGK